MTQTVDQGDDPAVWFEGWRSDSESGVGEITFTRRAEKSGGFSSP